MEEVEGEGQPGVEKSRRSCPGWWRDRSGRICKVGGRIRMEDGLVALVEGEGVYGWRRKSCPSWSCDTLGGVCRQGGKRESGDLELEVQEGGGDHWF